jgi:transposase InsO family protein
MHHRNAPLSVEGRRRLVARCQTRPIAHVAAAMGISRQCASKWVNRRRHHGETGLTDRPSAPHRQPTATPAEAVARIEQLRRDRKYSARRIATELAAEGTTISARTVGRHLLHLGLTRRRFLDPTGQNNRRPRRIIARWPGHMVHLDVKKAGQIPDGGGRRIHGKGSDQPNSSLEERPAVNRPATPICTPPSTATRGWPTPKRYPTRKPAPRSGSSAGHGRSSPATPVTHIHRIVTDNGACYRAHDFATVLHGARHQRITPYTPRHNGKVERYNRILAEEFLYSRVWTSGQHRTAALAVWNVHYNYHRPHTAAGDQPPASRLDTGVTNVTASYS